MREGRRLDQAVILTGMHSGNNPSPGVGVARSLREAGVGPLIGLDYSPMASGIHSDLIDERIIMPSWQEIDSGIWLDQKRLTDIRSAKYMSGLDAETRLIGPVASVDKRFLSPSDVTLRHVVKPPEGVALAICMQSVPSLSGSAPDDLLNQFVTNSAFGVWVKGQHYEAYRATSLQEVKACAAYIERLWGPPWHVEEHIEGQECAIAFSAIGGVLIDAVFMHKVMLTGDGKTWSGNIEALEAGEWAAVSAWVMEVGWTGGGELELVETWAGDRFLLEVNPRFPAWIHGATLAGHNLPASLVLGHPCRAEARASGFTRIVEEIPLRAEFGTPTFAWSADGTAAAASKHPSGMPSISRRRLIASSVPVAEVDPSQSSVRWRPSPPEVGQRATPFRILDESIYAERLRSLRTALAGSGVRAAYSVKTNPHISLMERAAQEGLDFEVISVDELRAVRDIGVEPSRIICNGRAKSLGDLRQLEGTTVFADNLAELRRLTDVSPFVTYGTLGMRIRARDTSNFGVSIKSSDLPLVAAVLRRASLEHAVPWGLHFHDAPSLIGADRWLESVRRVSEVGQMICSEIGSFPAMVNLGGGWSADTAIREAAAYVMHAYSFFDDWIPGSERPRRVIEPGKLLVQPVGFLVTRVLECRLNGGDVVVDAGIPDAPETQHWPHSVWVLRVDEWEELGAGGDRILGRTCMEQDVLRVDVNASEIERGDLLCFAGVGAYDSSMSYSFADGRGSG